MSIYSDMKKKAYALFITLSLLLLQVSLASANPHKLLATGFENQGVKSYLTAMDINSDSTMTTSESSRYRQRVQSAVVFDSVHRTVTDKIDLNAFPDLLGVALDTWLTFVGSMFEALPQSDMVARK